MGVWEQKLAEARELRQWLKFADAFGHDTTRVPKRFHRETERHVTR